MSKNQKSYCGMLIKEKMLSQLLKLNKEQLKNVHEFLKGKHIKTVEDILKGE